jgi:hypothetical protein
MNSYKYKKIVTPIEFWKKGIYDTKEVTRLQLSPDWNWGFSITNYGRQYDLGNFLKVSNHNYEDIYLTWKYIPWIPNYKHFWVIYKNMFIIKLNRIFLIEKICKQRKIPNSIERIIKKFLVS